MANQEEQARSPSHALKSISIWVGCISLAITALPALGVVAVFMVLFAPFVLPFMLAEAVSEVQYAHAPVQYRV